MSFTEKRYPSGFSLISDKPGTMEALGVILEHEDILYTISADANNRAFLFVESDRQRVRRAITKWVNSLESIADQPDLIDLILVEQFDSMVLPSSLICDQVTTMLNNIGVPWEHEETYNRPKIRYPEKYRLLVMGVCKGLNLDFTFQTIDDN